MSGRAIGSIAFLLCAGFDLLTAPAVWPEQSISISNFGTVGGDKDIQQAGDGWPNAPIPWAASIDIPDALQPPGRAEWFAADNSYVLHAAGKDIWGAADEFHYLFVYVQGDFEISSMVDLLPPFVNTWSKAGLMFRANRTAGSPHCFVCTTNGGHAGGTADIAYHHRVEQDGPTLYDSEAWSAENHEEVFLVMKRTGPTIQVDYDNVEGTIAVGWQTYTHPNIDPTQPNLLGLALCSHAPGTLTSARFWGVTVTGAIVPGTARVSRAITRAYVPGGAPAQVVLTADASGTGPVSVTETLPPGLTPGNAVASAGTPNVVGQTVTWDVTLAQGTSATLTYDATPPAMACRDIYILDGTYTIGPITETIPGDTEIRQASDGWAYAPIPWAGSVDIPSSLQPSGRAEWFACDDSYLIWGQGADIWGTGDEFHFLYSFITGDFTLQAQVEHVGPVVNTWSIAGLMARANFTTGSPNVNVFLCRSCRDGEPYIVAKERVDQDGPSQMFDGRSEGSNPDIDSFAPNTGPAVLRIQRVGQTISVGFDNLEGTARLPVWYGADRPNVPTDLPIPIGLIYTSHQRGELGGARFTNVLLQGGFIPVPAIAVDPTSFTIVAQQNETTPTRTVEIWNSNGGTLDYDITASPSSLIDVHPASGQSDGSTNTHTVSFKTFGRAPGNYTGNIFITGNATNRPVTIPVEVTVTAQPVIAVSPASISVSVAEGPDGTATPTLEVWNGGDGTLAYDVAAKPSALLGVYPYSGQSSGEHVMHVVFLNTAGLSPGTYTGSITVTSNATNSIVTIPVEVTVVAVGPRTITVGKGGGYDYDTIQAALDTANYGDTVLVYPATYVENIQFHGKNIILRSTDPTDTATVAATVIDSNKSGSVVTFSGGESSSCVLSGFTIQHGRASGGFGGGICGQGTLATIENNTITGNWATGSYRYGKGGGLFRCNGTIQNNTIRSNSANYGGGLYECDGAIQHNTISGNTANNIADSRGGGLYGCDGSIQHNTIVGNTTSVGGGGLSSCQGIIQYNMISGNTVARSLGSGGGLAACNGTIQYNTVSGNRAGFGGGLSQCDGAIRHNTISANTAYGDGGGVIGCDGTILDNTISGNAARRGGGLYGCDGTIKNNTISGNSASIEGGGGLFRCHGTILNNTISHNWGADGGGLSECRGTIGNCIVWGNTPDQLDESHTPFFSCIEGWPGGGVGNISVDPLFTTGPLGPYYLSQTAAGQATQSPCVDAGSGTAAELALADRTTRTDGVGDAGIVDMGFHYPATAPPPLAPTIAVSPTSFAVTAGQLESPPTRTLEIWNSGGMTLDYDIVASPSSLIEVHPAVGQSDGSTNTHTVSFETFGRAPGTYTGNIFITGNATNRPVTIPVEVTVTSLPVIAASPTSFSITVQEGDTAPTQTLEIWNSGTGTLAYDVVTTSMAFLMTVAPMSGQSTGLPNTHAITFDTAQLAPGAYDGGIWVTSANAANSPVVVPASLTVTPSPPRPPNLILSEADIGPVAPVQLRPDDPIVLSAFVENTGEGPAGVFWTEVWGSRTGGLQLDRFLADSLWLGGLAGGSAYSWATTASLYGLPDGPYTVVYAVDRPGDVAETNERDNRAVVAGKRLLVIRPQTNVDLAVEGFGMAPNPAQSGQQVAFSGRVVNRGTEPSGPFWVEFWGSWDWPYPAPNFFLCDSIAVANLEAGAALDLANFPRTLYSNLPRGLFMAGCIADRDDAINELDETNNHLFIEDQVFNLPAPPDRENEAFIPTGADLTIRSAEFAPAAPVQSIPGDTITVTVELANLGNLNSGTFWLEYWGSRDGGLTLKNFLMDSDKIVNLRPGHTVSLSWAKRLYSIPDGPYTVVVVADRPGDVAETNEANNRRAVAGTRLLVVRPPTGANLVIEDFALVVQRPPKMGQIPDGIIRNAGTADSGPFWLEFWACAGDPDYPRLERFAANSIPVANLAPGEELSIGDQQRALYNLPAGAYVIIAIADRLDQVIETDETDNYQFVRGHAAPAP